MINAKAQKRTQTRLPLEIYQWLSERAKHNDRSMNAELVRILKDRKELEKSMTSQINT